MTTARAQLHNEIVEIVSGKGKAEVEPRLDELLGRYRVQYKKPPADAGSQVTAIARHPTHLDLFTVGTDNRIYSTWWDANGGWAGWFVISGGVAKPGSTVTAIARLPEHIDVFAVGSDSVVYSAWWDGATGWSGWFQLSVT